MLTHSIQVLWLVHHISVYFTAAGPLFLDCGSLGPNVFWGLQGMSIKFSQTSRHWIHLELVFVSPMSGLHHAQPVRSHPNSQQPQIEYLSSSGVSFAIGLLLGVNAEASVRRGLSGAHAVCYKSQDKIVSQGWYMLRGSRYSTHRMMRLVCAALIERIAIDGTEVTVVSASVSIVRIFFRISLISTI